MLSQRQTTASARHSWTLRVYISKFVDVRAYIVIFHDANRAGCRNRKVNRGAILCSRKQGSAPAGNTIEKANRDQYYASLLASMQNNSGPKPRDLKSR